MSEARLLEGLNVVDLGVGMAPALVARFLADSGARVTRIPPEPGDPFDSYYAAYGVWRRGATFEAGASAERLEDLLGQADICLIGGEDHPDIERRCDGRAIAARHPRLVLLDFTDGPAGTAYAGKPQTDLLAQARSGLAWEQLPDRPIVNAFEPGNYGAALQGLIGLLAALYEREGSGLGQYVATSLFEGALAWTGFNWAILEKPTPAADYVVPRGVSPLVFQTRDGAYIHLVIGGAGSKYGMYQALEIDDPTVLPTDSGMPKPGASPRNFYGDYDLLAVHVAKKDKDELLEAIWSRGLPAEPVLEPGACWDEPQIARNGIIVRDSDGTRRVGLPFLVSLSPANGPMRPPAAPRRPLEGIRVIDCGAFVAGPLAGVFLADLGAEVIKVEAKAGDPNRSLFKAFTLANRGKKAIGVDLKDPDGRAILDALCASADVVMSNFRPGVSARLGVDPATLHGRKPDLIVAEAPAYGTEGPLALKAGFDMVMQAWCGHEAKAAGRGNPPRWNRSNLVDSTGGMIGTVAVLAALYHRARTGDGAALELPLVNAGIFGHSELFQHPDGRFDGARQLSSGLRGYHPAEALYEASDGWVAVAARGRKAALALRDRLGLAGSLSDRPETWEEAEEDAIAAALRAQSSDEIVRSLGSAGIWVEPARTDMERRILTDEALVARGTVRTVPHPTFGVVREIGSLVTFSRSAYGNDIPAPIPGGSTREILADLSYDENRIEDLDRRGVVVIA
ncbi:CaiB/BaiF CoA-transferase family protein [Sphingosinicella terrae]|uniref:CaiB/BaiF CoA-transferase family protein n=1 Tax=Sphingosinicella terrae TaxID=2172047 RepID=UPI0013B3A1CA|nr:CoA transferase [Sphingosinicella terrae]